MPRDKRKNMARAIEHHERKEYIRKIDRAFNRLSNDFSSDRVLIAVTQAPNWRVRPEQQEPAGSICLPEVARYNAGYRKSKNITAR